MLYVVCQLPSRCGYCGHMVRSVYSQKLDLLADRFKLATRIKSAYAHGYFHNTLHVATIVQLRAVAAAAQRSPYQILDRGLSRRQCKK